MQALLLKGALPQHSVGDAIRGDIPSPSDEAVKIIDSAREGAGQPSSPDAPAGPSAPPPVEETPGHSPPHVSPKRETYGRHDSHESLMCCMDEAVDIFSQTTSL